MITSKEYPSCPKCEGITYPTFDHKTRKPYLKCYSCGYDSRKDVRAFGGMSSKK